MQNRASSCYQSMKPCTEKKKLLGTIKDRKRKQEYKANIEGDKGAGSSTPNSIHAMCLKDELPGGVLHFG